METEEKIKTIISQDVNSSYEVSSGIGLKQIKYLLFSIPFLVMLYYFPLHHPNRVVDFIVRVFVIIVIEAMYYFLLKIEPYRHARISSVEILEEKIKFKSMKKKGKNVIYYSKKRKEST